MTATRERFPYPPTADDVRALLPGDEVRMPCAPLVWITVTGVRDHGYGIFTIYGATTRHGGELPLQIRKAGAP